MENFSHEHFTYFFVSFLTGFVDENNSLNWECACRGSMVASRCGVEMRDFFQCIHDNMDNEEKSDACLEPFHSVKSCMDKNAHHYKELEEASPEKVVSAETSK
ncbi:Mitochondrial intermembrane space import and assembly protein 40 [Mizuhopecten yessoensis]|uniref:Mitochondrial intermembrane space import and assembly protein 40 n=1 Tax=Mizuhopecten yessoensis TaxID=6573 RepID=A0A210PDD2_MIZYE|nr:Mitochondrial intermembrane space import and assembly protein 40 [Mizuhopecten yessoensis]